MKIPLKAYWQLLARYIRPQWPTALLLALLLLGGIALQLINPQIIRYFIDQTQAGAPFETLEKAAFLFLGLALVQQAVSVLAKYTSENVAWKTTNALRADLADHCLHLDLSFHNAHTPGEMIERLDGDVTALSNFFSQFVVQFAGNIVLLAGILVLLFFQDWRVGLILSAFAGVALIVMGRFHNIAVPYWAGERQASAELYGFLEERLAGTEDIRANGAEAYVMRRFFQLMRTLLQRGLKAGMQVNILLNSMFFLFSAGTAAGFAIGAYLFQEKILTIGAVYIIFSYTSMLERPINAIVHQVEDLQKAGAGIGRIKALLEVHSKLPQEMPSAEQGVRLTGPLAVAFQGVSFGYDDNPPVPGPDIQGKDSSSAGPAGSRFSTPDSRGNKERVLEDISFRLRPGAVLGLLGRTGSGKTTLARLLFRFYDPDRGCVLVATRQNPGRLVDIRELSQADYHQSIGLVTQDIQLFNAPVRDNLTFFNPGVPDEKIWQVVNELGLGDWLKSLPMGLDTVLESGGSGLSAGEAQLLAFVRIFLKDPGLVILDEASSRLDLATERLIERAVTRLVKDRTAIIIAHRLATIQRADEIMVLENGRVLEHGERERLALDPGSHFHQLLQTGLEEVLV